MLTKRHYNTAAFVLHLVGTLEINRTYSVILNVLVCFCCLGTNLTWTPLVDLQWTGILLRVTLVQMIMIDFDSWQTTWGLTMSIMQAQPHCVELLLRLICLCVYVIWFCWVNVILLFAQRCGLCVFFIYFSSFALSICFKSLGRYELFQSLFHYFYVELNSAWTFITDACIRSGAIQHQDSFSLDKEVHWYCWITWSLWILAVFWRHCCCLRHWVTYLLVRVKIFYGKMSHSSEWEEIWNRGGTLQSDDVCWSLYTPRCFLLRQTFLCLTKLWVLCGFMGFMLLL